MLRNYNGNVDRAILRDLQRICKVNAENMENLLKENEKNGEVYFCTNMFMNFPDEMSEAHTLKGETEIKEYLQKDAQERFDRYLSDKNPAEDYLLSSVVEYIKENGKFPSKDEMRQLEQTAEAKRVAECPINTTAQTTTTIQDVMKEILELSAEIMEIRREINPKDIYVHDEPCYDELRIENDEFYALIEWNRYYGQGNIYDYMLRIEFRNDKDINIVSIYSYTNDGKISASAKNWCDNKVDLEIDRLITIHKGIVKFAEQEEFEFVSEIDYTKLT